jgi:DNA-binding MarR family transcriptional regulator
VNRGSNIIDILLPPKGQYLREEAIRGGMDLLFFVNTRHLKRVDEKLASLGLGRAHHRVLYFVARKPDLNVSELLAILDITKQSLGRVSRELVDNGLVEMRTTDRDRRQRLMRLTPEGERLEAELFDQLHENVARAYADAGADAVGGFWIVMQHLMGAEGRSQFRVVQGLT